MIGRRYWRVVAAQLLLLGCSALAQQVRIRDVARWQESVKNPLVGYGVVVGLNRTGDSLTVRSTIQTITNVLKNFGVFVSPQEIRMRNVAAVMVTAELLPGAREGDRLDAHVASIGDASSLEGGALLMTPLFAADGEIYVEAQGPVSLGGFNVGTRLGTEMKRNHPTAGWVPGGGLVVLEPPAFAFGQNLVLQLHEQDPILADRVVQAINARAGAQVAKTEDARSISLTVPEAERENVVRFMADVEQLAVESVPTARVVVNEKTGTVVIGGEVKLSPVAIAHGDLKVEIKTTQRVVPAAPLTPGRSRVETQQQVTVEEGSGRLHAVSQAVTVQQLTDALNAIGATPRDLIAILQALKRAGALHGELHLW